MESGIHMLIYQANLSFYHVIAKWPLEIISGSEFNIALLFLINDSEQRITRLIMNRIVILCDTFAFTYDM